MPPKTLDDILPPPLKHDFLLLRCHFNGYRDDILDSNFVEVALRKILDREKLIFI